MKPVRGRYIFEQPSCSEYHDAYGDGGEDSLWRNFDVITLTHNHRQGSEKTFADMLNRIRTGEHTEDDMKILLKRVKRDCDSQVNDCVRIYPTVRETIEFNERKINNLPGKLYTIAARNFTSSKKNFKPTLDKAGRIADTQFINELHLKVGARIMLIYNIGNHICLITNF